MSKKVEFVPSQAFLLKKEQHLRKLTLALQQQLLQDLQELKNGDFNDIDLFIEGDRMHIYHKSVLSVVAPTFYLTINFTDDAKKLSIIATFPDNIPNNELTALKVIYGSDCALAETFEMNLACLLESNAHADVTLKVGEDLFQSHKCILSMRSKFFQMMFSGHWAESENQVVNLKCISPKVFPIVLDVLYNNKVELALSAGDLRELLTISDMYKIDCLQKVLLYQIKSNFCHFFHMPCQLCISGVLDTIALCSDYFEYKSVIADCYKWFVRYYVKIFVNKKFLKASQVVKENITKEIKDSVTLGNVLQHLQDCIQIKARLPQVKTVTSVRDIVTEIEKFCLEFTLDKFVDVVNLPAFLYSCYDVTNVNKNLMLQEFLIEGISEGLTIENCIGIYHAGLTIETYSKARILCDGSNEAIENCEKFYKEIKNATRKFIQTNYAKVKRTSEWKNLRGGKVCKEIMEGSGFVNI